MSNLSPINTPESNKQVQFAGHSPSIRGVSTFYTNPGSSKQLITENSYDIDSPRFIKACKIIGYSPTECKPKKKGFFKERGISSDIVDLRYEHNVNRALNLAREVLEERDKIIEKIRSRSSSKWFTSRENASSSSNPPSPPRKRFNMTGGLNSSMDERVVWNSTVDLDSLHDRNCKLRQKEAERILMEEEKCKNIHKINEVKVNEAARVEKNAQRQKAKKVEALVKRREQTLERRKHIEKDNDEKIDEEKDRQEKDNHLRQQKLLELDKDRYIKARNKEIEYRTRLNEVQRFHERLRSQEDDRMHRLINSIEYKETLSSRVHSTLLREKSNKMHATNEKIAMAIDKIVHKQKDYEEKKANEMTIRDKSINKRIEVKVKEITKEWKWMKNRGKEKYDVRANYRAESLNLDSAHRERMKTTLSRMIEAETRVEENQNKFREKHKLDMEKKKLHYLDMEENKKRQQRLHQAKVEKLVSKYQRADEWLKARHDQEEKMLKKRVELEKNSKLERERMLETVQHYTKKPLPRINQLKLLEELGVDPLKVQLSPRRKKRKPGAAFSSQDLIKEGTT